MTHITWGGVVLIMYKICYVMLCYVMLCYVMLCYNLLSLNWHVSVSQNNYTSKQGFCCSHGFISLMLIQIVKLKLESDMSLANTIGDIWITYKECDNNRCLAV